MTSIYSSHFQSDVDELQNLNLKLQTLKEQRIQQQSELKKKQQQLQELKQQYTEEDSQDLQQEI